VIVIEARLLTSAKYEFKSMMVKSFAVN